MPTLADVAKVAGVGLMSVSRVVHGTRRVSPETERKVRMAIKRIGYEPNEAARMLKGHRARTIGLIVPDLADPFFSRYANAVQETAWESGYMTLMAASGHREDRERHEMDNMIRRQVAGLLVTPVSSLDDHFVTAKRTGVPIVSFDRPLEHAGVDTLLVDNRAAAFRATEHLIEHGHQQILCLADEEKIFTKAERCAGYADAMRRRGLPVRICLVGGVSGSLSDQLNGVLNTTPQVTAIFATSNMIAVAALRELQARRIRMPNEMALIAFDDFDAATLVCPPMTVVRQPIAELGRKATSMLLARISGETGSQGPLQVVLPTDLVLRESCGCQSARRRKRT